MNISEYISHVFKGQIQSGEHQYLASFPKSHYKNHPLDLERELKNFYSESLYGSKTKKSQLFNFLDFHLSRYRGEAMDFFDFVKNSPSCVKHSEVDDLIHLFFIPNHLQRLGEWVESREGLESETGGVDTRIAGKLTKDEIQNYFIEKFVNSKDKRGVSFFNEQEVLHFLKANFKGFKPREEVRKIKSKAVGAQTYIRRVVYQLYLDNSICNSSEKRRYCELLRDNFQEFSTSDFEMTIITNFSK